MRKETIEQSRGGRKRLFTVLLKSTVYWYSGVDVSTQVSEGATFSISFTGKPREAERG